MKSKFGIVLLLISVALGSAQCKKKSKEEEVNFDIAPVMSNLADNYILPGYADLQTTTNGLAQSWSDFLSNQNQVNLELVQSAWKEANLSFQRVKLFDLGPAMQVGLASSLGTFPADTVQIQTNISSGSYSLTTAENIDAIGFDALDYLLFKSNALTDLSGSVAARDYVTAVITKMKSEVDNVVSAWVGYKATFIAGTGNSSTSPFALLVNAFCKDFEIAKTVKLGIPIGTQSLGIQQPHYLEARRSGFGKELLTESIKATRMVFNGIGLNQVNGQGFDDYLSAIEKASLNSTIQNRFDYMVAVPPTWSGSIETNMSTNAQSLTDFYNYMQGTVVYMKTDMSSAFGVLITYQDNDGD